MRTRSAQAVVAVTVQGAQPPVPHALRAGSLRSLIATFVAALTLLDDPPERLLVTAFVLTAVLGAAGAAWGQKPPRELWGLPVVEVEIAGHGRTLATPEDVGIEPGTTLTRRVIRRGVERLVDSGRWTDIQVDAVAVDAGVKLQVHLEPRIVVRGIEIGGNDLLSDEELAEALEVGPGSELTVDDLERLSARLTEVYATHGYLGAEANITLQDTGDPARKILRIRVREGAPTRIGHIEFAGEQPRSKANALEAMELSRGDVLSRREIREAIGRGQRHLRQERYLEAELGEPDVEVRDARARLSIPTRIGPRYAIAIRGYAPLEFRDVYETLELGRTSPTQPGAMDELRDRILDLYRRHGFVEARVRVLRQVGHDGERARLEVRIEPGPHVRVVAVRFPGADHFTQGFLRDQLVSYLQDELPGVTLVFPVDSHIVDMTGFGVSPERSRSVPPPLVVEPSETYYPATYAEAIEHITQLYQADGFLSARVGPERILRPSEERAIAWIPVFEGPRTRLHRVTVEGNNILSARELLTAADLRRGAPFSYLRLEEARLKILEVYRERGYMFAKVEPSVRFSADRTRAEVSLQIVERFALTVERVEIRGASRTSEELIYDLVQFRPGDVYRPSLARESEEDLLALGVFSGVTIAPLDKELPARVKPVVVTVVERPNQLFGFSAGVSTGQGVRTNVDYGYRNLFRRAVGVTLRVQLSQQLFYVDEEARRNQEDLSFGDRLERRIALGTVIPYNPLLPRVRTAIDLVHLRENEREFGLDKNGIALTFTRGLMRHTTLTLTEDLENNEVDLFTDDQLDVARLCAERGQADRTCRLLRVPSGNSTLVASGVSLSYDRRDNPFIPTSGFFGAIGVEAAFTLRTENVETEITADQADQGDTTQPTTTIDRADFVSRFLKLTLSTSGYLPLGNDLVLAGQFRTGRIVHLVEASQTYPNRAFFMGGFDTMRGYFQDALMPQDKADEIRELGLDPDSVVRSGDAFVLLRGELRFPIVGELHGGVFMDVGNLWADAAQVDPFEMRASAGLGVRLQTPVGPLAFDWGVPLRPREEFDEPSIGTPHFSIGLF